MNVVLTVLLTSALLFAGCAEEVPEAPEPGESQLLETMPALTYGQMEYEKLKVEPWYCGRVEATGFNRWAEAKDGIYYSYGMTLMYTDKAEIGLWVPVCDKPICNYAQNNSTCHGYIGWGTFLIHNNRIYFTEITTMFPE